MNLEYTLQYLQDNDWVRITAIYDSLEQVGIHAKDMLFEGMVIRLLVRAKNDTGQWYTIRMDSSNRIKLNNPTNCPR